MDDRERVSWSDDAGETWEDHIAAGQLLYSDRTIGYLDTRSVTVSTDRGKTWTEHRIASLRTLALRDVAHPGNWDTYVFATRSGTVLLLFNKWVGDTLTGCYQSDCFYSRDLGRTWRTIDWPD